MKQIASRQAASLYTVEPTSQLGMADIDHSTPLLAGTVPVVWCADLPEAGLGALCVEHALVVVGMDRSLFQSLGKCMEVMVLKNFRVQYIYAGKQHSYCKAGITLS